MRMLTPPAAALALFIGTVNAVGSAGCGTALSKAFKKGGDSNTISIKSSNVSRDYNLYVPVQYKISTPSALILSFHGGSQTADDQEELSQLSNPDFNPDGIAIYPQGLDNCWQGVPGCADTDDIEFTANVIADVSSSYCIDSTRIYATGMSDGGGFLGLLACNSTMANTISAFAPVSGAFYSQNSSMTCDPGRSSIPILEFHGTDDTTIPYTGGPRKGDELPSVSDWLSLWASRNGDDSKNTTWELFKGNVQVSSWNNVTMGYLIDGLGHAWPSTVSNIDNSAGTYLNATPIIMDFFGNNTLSSTSASSSASGSASGSATSATSAATTTAKSAASPMPTSFAWEHILFFLGFSAFVSFEILSIGFYRFSEVV